MLDRVRLIGCIGAAGNPACATSHVAACRPTPRYRCSRVAFTCGPTGLPNRPPALPARWEQVPYSPHRSSPCRPASCLCPQCLDLSNCCLTRVPTVLASLPRLTSLTLNENDALGASDEALAPLSVLTSLQVCVDAGVTWGCWGDLWGG